MSQIKKLQNSLRWTLPTALDEGDEITDGATSLAYGVQGWPNLVIIDRQGKCIYNQNLEHWTKETVQQEMSRAAKAAGLPEMDSNAFWEEQIAWLNRVNVFRLGELIDKALEQK
jgi:hypothetical protein